LAVWFQQEAGLVHVLSHLQPYAGRTVVAGSDAAYAQKWPCAHSLLLQYRGVVCIQSGLDKHFSADS
jgi:hypothetical protein